EGLLAELEKINKSTVTARKKEIEGDPESADELKVLKQWLKLSAKETALKKQVKDADTELDDQAYAKYPELSEDEIKKLVADDKWLATLDAAVHGEMDRISQSLTQRVKELAERYERPLPELSGFVADLEEKVGNHLARMGFAVFASEPTEVET
ncbi:MAG: type I restriction endonuclease subunit M, partial [Candidatus Paceibacterota bacterium]